MRIVLINAVYGVRSTGRNVAEMADYFREHGHECYVVATRLTQNYDNVYQIGNRIEWYIHQGLSRLTGHQGYFSRLSTKKMLKWLEEIKPDIVHLNNLRAGAFNFPLLFDYLAKKDIPTVITLHDCFMYTGRCWYYTVKGCYQWQTSCQKCPSIEKCEGSPFFDFSHKFFEDKKKWLTGIKRLAVIGVSKWITDEARKSFLKNATIVRDIYNWVDTDVFKPAEVEEIIIEKKTHGIKDEFVVLCIASGLTKEKGLNEILYLAENLPHIKIVLVGAMPKKVMLYNNMICLGTIENISKLALLYSLADVMVTPSPEETFGKTTAEAFACGTPVIGYNMTATAELLSEETGIAVDYRYKEKGILEAVKDIMKYGKSKYSKKCRDFALKEFNMKTNLCKHLDIYESIMAEK